MYKAVKSANESLVTVTNYVQRKGLKMSDMRPKTEITERSFMYFVEH